MPYPVYPVQNQTAQQLANIGSNLGVAMFGDANSMMRRKQLDQDLQYKQQQLALQREELGLKRSLNDSTIAMHNAQAQGYTQKNQGSSELAEVISQSAVVNQDGSITFDPNKLGAIAGAYAKANPNGDVAKTLGNLAAMSIRQIPGGASEDQYRQAAALGGQMPGQNTAFTTGQAAKLAKPLMVPDKTQGIIAPTGSIYEQPVKDYAAALDSSGNPAAVLPDGTINPIYTPNYTPPATPAQQPAQAPAYDPNGILPPASAPAPVPTATPAAAPVATSAPAAPSVADAFGAPAPQPQRPRVVGNAVILPQNQKRQQWGTASSAAKSSEQYKTEAENADMLGAKAAGLIGMEDKIHVDGGRIPVVSTLGKMVIGATDGKRLNLINEFQSLLTGDWLDKSQLLKGAITEMEGKQLRLDQPSIGDSPEAIKLWLEKIGYLADMKAAYERANLERSNNRMPPIDPLAFKRMYVSQRKVPAGLNIRFAPTFKNGELQQAIQPQTDQQTQQPSGVPAIGTVMDGHRFTGGNPADPSSWQPLQ